MTKMKTKQNYIDFKESKDAEMQFCLLIKPGVLRWVHLRELSKNRFDGFVREVI